MLPFNSNFQTGKAKITQIRLNVLLANNQLLELTEENVMLGGFILDSSTTVDGAFTIGAAVTGKLTVILDNSAQNLAGYDFRGAIITASLGGEYSPNAYQLIQVGIYTVDEYTYDGSNITLTAYDNLHKFDIACSASTVTFPCTLQQLVTQACSVAGVTLANVDIPIGSFSVPKKPSQWDVMTWHDVISYCAQMVCCFVRALPDGRIYFYWYNTDRLNTEMLDGGTFLTNTIPYSDGGTADGGDFDYLDTDIIDGGHFADRDDAHVISSIFNLSIDTDDVLITGVSVSLDPTNNIDATDGTKEYITTRGTAGYIVRIENNPLIETSNKANLICMHLYFHIVGMRFRPLTASVIENPSLEAGDVAIVTDRYNNTYYCFLSHVTYMTGGATIISCDAESSLQNLKARYGESQKTRALAQRTFERAVMDADAAMQMILSAYATTMGLYQYAQSDGQGGTVYIYGNKNTLAASNIRWKFSAGAMMVSSDYGVTWNAAISSDGIAVLQEIYAMKISADNIVTGTLKVGGNNNQNGLIQIYNASGQLRGTISNDGIDAMGSFLNYRSQDGYATRIDQGRIYFFCGDYTYDQLKNLTWSDARGKLNSAWFKDRSFLGFSIATSKSFISLGKSTGINEYYSSILINTSGGSTPDGYSEPVIVYGPLRMANGNGIRLRNANIHLYKQNEGAGTGHTIRWYVDNSETDYAYIMYAEGKNHFVLIRDTSTPPGLYVGNLTAYGTKNRAVDTKHYGTVGMNAFETASSHFADLGSATVGIDGTVSIFFDPVFAETIEINSEYQVFLTRTSEAETSWVEKHNGYFIVHGDAGATFDWMIVGYQKDYATNRMEQISPPEKAINNDPIVEDNTVAIDAVEQMVQQYNSHLEDI